MFEGKKPKPNKNPPKTKKALSAEMTCGTAETLAGNPVRYMLLPRIWVVC